MKHIKESEFGTAVEQAAKPVLVDFSAEWCPPCKMLAPVVERLSLEFADQLDVVGVDIDQNQQLSQRFNIFPRLRHAQEGSPGDTMILSPSGGRSKLLPARRSGPAASQARRVGHTFQVPSRGREGLARASANPSATRWSWA
jgi:thioredoxin 1